MSSESVEAFRGLDVPQFQGLIGGSAYKVARVVWAELDIKNCATEHTELVELCPARHIPQPHTIILSHSSAAACQVPPVGTEGDCIDQVAAISRMSVTHVTVNYALSPVTGHWR